MKAGVEGTGAHTQRRKTGRKFSKTATAVTPGEGAGPLRTRQSAPEGCVRRVSSLREFHLNKNKNNEGKESIPGDK